jgi:isoprenylcysteine carboxyl methyltransferase (ICMT) family protein YpbQ
VLGRFLFRWRGVIGFVAFGVVFWLAQPAFGSCLLGLPIILAGLATRFWASGYIGIEGRAREIGASRRIATGPYRILRHPLYIGNFLLVAGMLISLRPAVWLAVAVLAGFVAEYVLIIAAEEKDLACRRIQNPESRIQNAEVRTSVKSPQSSVGNPEFVDGKQGTVPGSRTGPCEGTVPVFRHGPESFLLSRALVEWRTWVATGAGFGLALLKAFVTR